MLPRATRRRPVGIAVGRRCRRSPSDEIEKLNDRAKTSEVEQVLGRGPGWILGGREVVGAAHRDGRVSSIRETDDEVGVDSPAQAEDLDALTAEGVVRMGDGDRSRGRLG
jgi:hypothetical protein